jgi:hypothetical protein
MTQNHRNSIYARMAATQMLSSRTYKENEFPHTIWFAEFTYSNGLIVRHDGSTWEVVQEETNKREEFNCFTGTPAKGW